MNDASRDRTGILHAAAMLLAATMLACSDSPTEPEQKRVVIAVAGQTNVVFLPLPITAARGYFRQQGLDVEILDVPSGAAARQALLDGSADVVMGFYEHTLTLQGQNTDALAIALVGNLPGLTLGVRSDLSSTIRTVKDLAGRTVGVSGLGAGSHHLLRFLLAKEGVNESTVTAAAIGLGATAEAAVNEKRVDALVNLDPAITALQNRSAISVLVDTRTSAGANAVYGGDYPSTTLYTLRAFTTDNPVTTQRIVNAIVQGLHWMTQSSPEQIAGVLTEAQVGGQRSLYVDILKKSTGMFSSTGRFTEASLRTVHTTVSRFDATVAAGNVTLSKTYTNEFVDQAR